MEWSNKFFEEMDFTEQQIDQLFSNAKKDLATANRNRNREGESEAVFTFTYNAFLKLGITLSASKGYKAKNRLGHHINIINQLSLILSDKKIKAVGQEMRKKRNIDLYAGGSLVTKKEATEYFQFVESLFKKTKEVLSK